MYENRVENEVGNGTVDRSVSTLDYRGGNRRGRQNMKDTFEETVSCGLHWLNK